MNRVRQTMLFGDAAAAVAVASRSSVETSDAESDSERSRASASTERESSSQDDSTSVATSKDDPFADDALAGSDLDDTVPWPFSRLRPASSAASSRGAMKPRPAHHQDWSEDFGIPATQAASGRVADSATAVRAALLRGAAFVPRTSSTSVPSSSTAPGLASSGDAAPQVRHA